jgi:EmrB/QacA subfamily drug resistance transporter
MTSKQRWVLTATVLAAGVVFLDSTVVNVALPKIGQELRSKFFGTLEAQSYVYNGYLLTLSALLILAGALSDYYGRKRTYALGLWGFALTSLLCGLSPNMDLLILARVLQGVAGALLVPGSLAIISSSFAREQQGRAFGIWSAASAATTLLGPLVGGALVDSIGWRVAFLINVPLILVALYALRYVDESRNTAAGGRFDWWGALTVALAVGGLAFGAIRGQEQNWRDPSAFVALALGAVAALVFPFQMRRSPNPLVPLSLFASRNFAVLNLSTFLIYGALYVSGYYQSLFFQGTLGYTALAAGAVGLPVGLLLTLLSARVGALSSRHGIRPFLTAGPLGMALGLLWMARIPPNSPAWTAHPGDPSSLWPSAGYWADVFPAMVVFALGLSLLVAPITAGVMASVPPGRSGLGSAINNAVSRVGPQLAGALVFVLITASFYADLDRRTGLEVGDPQLRAQIAPLNPPSPAVSPANARAAREASTQAFHLAMGLCAGLLLAGALANGLGLRTALGPAERSPT